MYNLYADVDLYSIISISGSQFGSKDTTLFEMFKINHINISHHSIRYNLANVPCFQSKLEY